MKIGKKIWGIAVLGVALFLPCIVEAQPTKTGLAGPRSVVVYADQAELAVQEKRVPEHIEGFGTGILLALPQDVDEDTFVVSANGEAVTNFYFLPDKKEAALSNTSTGAEDDESSRLAESPEQELDLNRRELLQKITALETQKAELLGEEAAAQARITLWTNNLSSEKTIFSLTERQQLDAGITVSLPAAYKQQELVHQQLVDVRNRLRDAYNTLEEYDKVFSCRYVVIPHGGSAQVTVDYHYCVPVSLEFTYVFNAFPKENKIILEQVATVAQHSGMNWNNVNVNITTSPRYRVLNPAQVLPWRLFFQRPAEAMGRASYQVQGMMAAESEIVTLDRSKMTSPVQLELGTARVWRLGKQSLSNLTPTKFSLSHDSIPATYAYTLRPALGAEAFLTALVDQEKSFEFPAGKAFFLVDGIAVGEEVITLHGSKFSLYFGNDPQVTGTVQLLEQVSDQQGLISKSNVRTWHWQMDIVNNRNREITVYVEDSMPHADDKAITLDVKATPEPEKIVGRELTHMGTVGTYYRWTLKLAAGAKQQIDYRVTATAPADKPMHSDR